MCSVFHNINAQRCKDGVMNDFVSWCMHLLDLFRFHEVTSLHPFISFEMIFPLVQNSTGLPQVHITYLCTEEAWRHTRSASQCQALSELAENTTKNVAKPNTCTEGLHFSAFDFSKQLMQEQS